MGGVVQLKVGRKIEIFDSSDVIMDNGACIQIITKTSGTGWNTYPKKMSKALFTKLNTHGFLYTDKELEEYAKRKYYGGVTLYKFNIQEMLNCDEFKIKGEQE